MHGPDVCLMNCCIAAVAACAAAAHRQSLSSSSERDDYHSQQPASWNASGGQCLAGCCPASCVIRHCHQFCTARLPAGCRMGLVSWCFRHVTVISLFLSVHNLSVSIAKPLSRMHICLKGLRCRPSMPCSNASLGGLRVCANTSGRL